MEPNVPNTTAGAPGVTLGSTNPPVAPVLPPSTGNPVPVPQPVVPQPQSAKPETITVDAAKLKSLMDRMDAIEEENKRLVAAANKAGLAHYDNANRAAIERKANIRSFNGKYIAAWKMVRDIVQKDAMTKAWIEDQVIRLTYVDDSFEEIPYLAFVNQYVLHPGTIKSKKELSNGTWVYEILLEDGTTYNIDTRFLN